MWGRATGLVVLLPAAFFWARRWLSPAMKKRVGVYAALVVLQVSVPVWSVFVSVEVWSVLVY